MKGMEKLRSLLDTDEDLPEEVFVEEDLVDGMQIITGKEDELDLDEDTAEDTAANKILEGKSAASE